MINVHFRWNFVKSNLEVDFVISFEAMNLNFWTSQKYWEKFHFWLKSPWDTDHIHDKAVANEGNEGDEDIEDGQQGCHSAGYLHNKSPGNVFEAKNIYLVKRLKGLADYVKFACVI